MLEGLDNIKWADLEHAYGSAADVPDLLRDLLSDDSSIREETLEILFSNIWHQGTVYEASAYAVPFFIELVSSDAVEMRNVIVSLLSALANGNSYTDVHVQEPEERETPGVQAAIAKELSYVEAAHQAVRKGIPVYLRLLHEKQDILRVMAGELLTHFPEDADQTLPALRVAAQHETVLSVRADFIAYIGALLGSASALPQSEVDTVCHLLDSLMSEAEPPLIRLAAAVARAQQSKANTAAKVVTLITDPLINEEAYKKPGTFYFSPVHSVLMMLSELGTNLSIQVLLHALANTSSRDTAHSSGRLALIAAFPEANIHRWRQAFSFKDGVRKIEYRQMHKWLTELPTPTTLTRLQQQVLTGIAESRMFWVTDTNLLTIPGLPQNRDALRDFVRDTQVTD